jgi:hypothetical protein
MQTSSSHFTRHVPEIIIHCGFGKHESDPTDLKLSQIIFWLPQVRSFPCFHGACPLEIFPPTASCSKSQGVFGFTFKLLLFFWFNRHSSPTPMLLRAVKSYFSLKLPALPSVMSVPLRSFFFLPSTALSSLSLCAHILLSVTRVTAAAPLRWAGGHGPHSGGAPPASSTDALPTPAAPHSSLYPFRAQARSVCYLVSTNPLLVL